MLAPIPASMLHDTVVFNVVKEQDAYGHKVYTEYTVSNVHLQADSKVIKGANDTEVRLIGILFVDARRSSPRYDISALQEESLRNGDTMRAVVYDASGKKVGDYAVLTVDDLPNVPATSVHHWEVGLV